MRWFASFAWLALIAVVGCAESQDPVNRVQPNAVAKSTFNGEFYFLETVIDTPYSTSFTFVGEQGSLQKIRWDIQEDYLIARRTYEYVDGTEGSAGLAGEGTLQGVAVAMFKIDSHFDIRREYNPLTGEETNVISENSQDRPWYEREYVRVDWSKNLMANSDFLALGRMFDGVSLEPMAYFPNNENDPFAPKFEKDENGNVYYMDIVNKAFVTPSSITFPGWGTLPVCYMYYNDMVDCQPSEISVRHSFLRVEDRDYQPNLYTGDRMEKFGYFETPRMGFDPHYGIVESARVHFNNRHNIWQESHRKNTDGTLVSCTSDDECDPEEGSVCDMARAVAYRQRTGACTIPYRERQIRKIAYHISANMPADLIEDTQHLVDEWNETFATTVASLRFLECDKAGYEGCEDQRDREDGKSVFVMCHNPVLATDDAACGGTGVSAQIGDLRYSMIGWVGEPHLQSPLGYGPSAADPLTGELIHANAFIYGSGVENIATSGRDLIALLNGDLSVTDINSGANIEQWIERQLFAQNRGAESGRPAHDHAIELDGFDAPRINDAMNFDWAVDPNRPRARPVGAEQVRDRLIEARDRLTRNGVFGNGTNVAAARLQQARGTSIESLMTNADFRTAVGAPATGTLSEDLLNRASPLRGMSVQARRELRMMRDRLQAKSCILDAEFADEGLLGLALEIKRAAAGDGYLTWYGIEYDILDDEGNLDQEMVRSMLRHPIYHAVTSHEVGHTVGLRHNFSGSYDSINYRPTYWQLRNDGNMQSRAFDPITQQEIDGRIREYQYSTVMDYGNNFVVTDADGLGYYDHAAIKMGYGDIAEVFASSPSSQGNGLNELLWVNVFSGWGWPFTTDWATATGTGFNTLQYTQYPAILGGGTDANAINTGIARLADRADVPYTSLRNYQPFGSIDDPIVDGQNRPRVPYLFCSDEQADLGPDCQRYDAGADWYETISSLTDTYWNYYILASFRRDRIGFNPNSYMNRTYGRYFEKLQSANQYYALYRPIITDVFGVEQDDPAWTTGGLGTATAGVGVAYNLFTNILTAPEPGSYGVVTRPDGTQGLSSSAASSTLELGVLDGRYISTTWDFDLGYYWFGQIERAGFFFDKALALQVLTDPTTYFVGRDTSSDIREYQLNFYTTFGPSLTGLFRNLLADNWSGISPRAASGTTLDYLDPLDFATDGPGTGTPVDPNASFSVQLYASLYSLLYIPQLYDQTYMNSARIGVVGGAEHIEFDGPMVTFTDPDSGITYEAASYIVEGRETGVGAKMLQHAAAIAADPAQRQALRKYMDNINIIRFLTWNLGFGTL